MTPVDRLTVGLIGAGLAGSRHARAWSELSDRARLVAVADPHETAGRAAAAATGARYYDGVDALLEGERVAVIDVCVPPHLHLEIVRRAASAGSHVLCEKPIATSLEDARSIQQVVATAGITYMAGHNTLFLPTIQRAAALLRSGDLGPVHLIRSLDCFEGSWSTPERLAIHDPELPAFFAPGAWRTRLPLLRGGALADGGVHAVYRLLHLAAGTPRAVIALTRSVRPDLPMEGEDSAVVLVDFSDGTIGEVIVSYAFGPPTTGGDTLFAVTAREGLLVGDESAIAFRPAGWGQPARQQLWEHTGRDAFWHATLVAELRHFLDSVASGRPPIAGAAEAIASLAVISAAYESVERGALVNVSL
jgi:predicted dehydrogenase